MSPDLILTRNKWQRRAAKLQGGAVAARGIPANITDREVPPPPFTEVKMAPKLLNILLQRDDSNVQWGFRISGGKDLAKPLTIVKVRNYIWS